jgi:ACS family pantothenate transporter-like MFS transporter
MRLFGSSCGGNGYFAIWLRIFSRRSKHHAHRDLAHLGDLCRALGFFVGLHGQQIRLAVDNNGRTCSRCGSFSRLTWILQVLGLLPNRILAVWPANIALKKFAFLTVNMHLVTAVLYVVSLFPNSRCNTN